MLQLQPLASRPSTSQISLLNRDQLQLKSASCIESIYNRRSTSSSLLWTLQLQRQVEVQHQLLVEHQEKAELQRQCKFNKMGPKPKAVRTKQVKHKCIYWIYGCKKFWWTLDTTYEKTEHEKVSAISCWCNKIY